jgi:hypothetical protein
MKRVWFSGLVLAMSALVVVSAQQTPPAPTSPAGSGSQQRGPAAPTGPVKRLPNGQVDLSGVWQGGGPVGDIKMGLAKGETLPIKPEWQKIMDARQSKEDPEANCLPTGVPRRDPYPWRILQTDTHTFLLFEGNIHSYRQIFMDGRKHPADLDPTWYGHSIGWWEKDTLVIDTIGFNDVSWLDARGTPRSTEMRIEERIRRRDFGHLELTITMTDSRTFTKPITISVVAELMPDTDLLEHYCLENEQDDKRMPGRARP